MTKVNQRIFDAAKILLESGNTQKEAASYLKISSKTMRIIASAETFEEYKQIMYETEKRYRAMQAIKAKEEEKKTETKKAAEPVNAVPASNMTQLPVQKPISMTIQATHFMETKLDVLIDLLKVMNNKLGAIIDDLYGTGAKGAESK